MSAETLSLQEHLSIIIQQIAKEHNFELDETTITVILLNRGEDAPQFKFKIRIVQEGREDLDLFAKVTELCNNNWESYLLKPFEKERLFYTRLMKIYRELEDKHGLTENEKLRLPKSFRVEAAHKREILILEDLTKKGFHLANRLESVSWQYASASITELAKFHALSMAFKNETPAEFEAFTNQIPGGVFENNEAYVKFLEEFKSLALSTVRNEHKKKLKVFFKSFNLTSFNDILKPSKCKVIVHGHFWPKNCMHKVLSDGTVELVTLDFQHIQPGSPVTDLFHFIFTASDASFRSKHYRELVGHYCSELIRATARLGVNIEQELPSEAMESEMIEAIAGFIQQKLPCGLYSAVAYLPVLVLDDRHTSGMVDEGDTAGFAVAELYSRRLNQVVDAYVAAGVLEEASTNLVGKFTQSVRRIVQDVKDEGASSGQTKEEVIETNERLRGVRVRLDENYDTAKKALIVLMARYSESKAERNVFTRYALLKAMIKDVIRLETQYWSLVEIPRQEKAETVPAFVLRACAIMEKTQKSGEGVKTSSKLAEEAADRRERIERLNDMTTSQIETENTQMTNDLYRLLKKYTGLRNLIRELKSDYVSSKVYPMFPRYTMLKDMIKDIMHDPDYMEVCHEVDP